MVRTVYKPTRKYTAVEPEVDDGLTLFRRMFRKASEMLHPEYEEEKPITIDPHFLQYQDDPERFIREELHEELTEDVWDVCRSVRDNPVTIARSGNGTGKTHGAARIATWWYKCFPGAQVITAAAPPVSNLQDLLWGEIGGIVADNPDLFKDDYVTTLEVKRASKEFIKGLAIPKTGTPAEQKAAFSGKHAPFLLFILDEGDGIPPEIYEAIESCMSGGRARLLIMFNPRAEMGPVYLKERDKQAHVVELTAFNHPNVLTGEDLIPGAVTREMTVRRIHEWTRPVMLGERVDEGCFEVPDFLVGCTAKAQDGKREYPPLQAGIRKITFAPFSYMVLARYPLQGENQLINKNWIDAARFRWDQWVARHGEVPPKGVRPVLGQDVAEMGTDESVLFPRWGGFVGHAITWEGVDTDESAKNLRNYYRKLNALEVFIDGTGVGAGVWGPLHKEKGITAHRVMVASSPTIELEIGEFNLLRDQLLWSVRDWLKDEEAMLPPDDMLLEELRLLRYEVLKNGKIRITDKTEFRQVLRRSCDRLDALALTFAPKEACRSKKLVTF